MAKQKRRKYTAEFRAEAVALVEQEGVTQSQVARDLGISQSLLSKWVQNAKVAALPGALTVAEREEMRRLKRENAILRQERDILKKAAAFFAKEM
jgi:transposase